MNGYSIFTHAQYHQKVTPLAAPPAPLPSPPDPFADIRGKRMDELSQEQRDRALELWLREQYRSFGEYFSDRSDALFPSLFRVIDRLRGLTPVEVVNGGIAEQAKSVIVGEKPSEQNLAGDCGEAGHAEARCGNASCVVTDSAKRVRSPKGWAVEAGLGLGSHFNERKKT